MQSTSETPELLVEKITPVGELFVANGLLARPDELRKQLKQGGYLYLQGVLDQNHLADVRRDILGLCKKFGWLKQDAPLMDGVFRGSSFPSAAEYRTLYDELVGLYSFNAFSISMEIIELFGQILDGTVLAHRRNIARVSFPKNNGATTQPHQDFVHIHGSPETYTAWMPTADCPRVLGGLTILEGSHKGGAVAHTPSIGAGGCGIPVVGRPERWLASDFKAGDILIFHSQLIHAALDNQSEDRMRISLDFRYQRAVDAIDPSSMRLHFG